MKHPVAILLLAGALSACDKPISTNNQPVTGDHPAPATDTAAGLDTLAAPAGSAAPFVNPVRAQHGRGIRHPSPAATRTR
jgi:hypothetical protein